MGDVIKVLFCKAVIRGGAGADLFATPIIVQGHTKKDGTYVAPHASVVHKRREEAPAPASAPAIEQPKLPLEAAPAPPATRSEGLFAPRAEPAKEDQAAIDARFVGRWVSGAKQELARLHSDEMDIEAGILKPAGSKEARLAVMDALRAAVDSRTIEDMRSTSAAVKAAKADLTQAESQASTPASEQASTPPKEQVPAYSGGFGVPAGTTPAARRKLNAAAIDILNAKADSAMTPADREALAKYTGNGGCGDSLNEFYTPPEVASAMWSLLANCGFQGGAVLEPSCGTGVFLHTAPPGSRVTGVEIEPVSARIAGILSAGAGHDVRVSSLERFATQDPQLFDAVIGNAPFGKRNGTMAADPDKRDLGKLEAYFLDTGLDKLKDGGLMAMIVDTGVMNSRNGRAFRERLLRKAEFLGAIRLPNSAFSAANTDVTSDILVFRKRPADVAGALGTLTQKQLQETGAWDTEFLSRYFELRGAANIHGTVGTAMRAFGPIYSVHGSMEGVPESIANWHPDADRPEDGVPDMPKVLAVLGADEAAKQRAIDAAQKRPYGTAKLGDIRTIDGVRYQLQGDPPRWHKLEADVPEAVEAALKISEGLDDLAEGRAKDPALARAEVAEGLDEFISQHGLPTRNKELLQWIAAPSLDRLADEHPEDHSARVTHAKRRVARLLGAVNADGTYSDLISGRMEAQTEAALDTVAAQLVASNGSFTVDQLAAKSGKPSAEILDHLFATPGYALEPDGSTWTSLDSYLSGELWPKLDAATAAAAHEGLSPAYRDRYLGQVKALEEAIMPASLEDVEILMSSGFITPQDLNAFFAANHAAARDRRTSSYATSPITVSYDDAVYRVSGSRWDSGIDDPRILSAYLNRDGVRGDDRPILDRVNEEFAEWVRTGPLRDEIEDRYNRLYKGFRQREYSDAPMVIPGLNPGIIDVKAYHFSGLRWALEQGKGIVADDVGLGKTARGMMLAKLAKVHGTAQKPTFVVPKSVLANWVEETQFWFPGSRVLVIGESYEQNPDGSFKRDKEGKLLGKSDTEAQRREKYHQLQQNSYDFVLISRPSWDKLDLSPIVKGQYAADEFWNKRAEKLGKAGNKKIAKIRDAHDAALARREFKDREGTIYFDDLGIDMLIMDEAHAYKNLFSVRNRFGMSPKFLGGSGESNRAQDTYFKSKWVREKNGGKNVYLLTATPTKNSPLEVYSMLSHVAPEAFERMGIKNSEDFIDRFVEFEEEEVFGVSGEMEGALVTAGFKNMGELREVMRRYINRRTAEDVGLELPEAERFEHLLDMTPEQEAVYQGLRAEAAAASSSKSDASGESHIFSIMDRMQKASTDLALLGHDGSDSPKLRAVAEKAKKGAEDGGQIIFCEPVDEHERIAGALGALGVPRDKIAIINAKVAPSSADRQRISDAFNKGQIEYVIGNKTMEEGVNLQKRTSDIHHVDIPWEPATLQQRNGRGRRQGNKRKNIRLHTYLAKKSFDVYRHQTIAAKKNWQDLLWNGGDRVENLAREGGLSLRDISIMLSPDPEAALAKLQSDKEAAMVRKGIADRARAAQSFRRYRDMRTNLAKLHPESMAAVRLSTQIARARELLAGNAAFTHKDLLDSDEPVIIDPVQNIAWRKGMGIEAHPGSKVDVQGDKPEQFVVDIVDHGNDRVWLRSVGDRRKFPVSLNAEELQEGVTPWAWSPEAEEAARRDFLATEGEKKVKEAGTFDDVYGLPRETVSRHYASLQGRLKDAVKGYKLSFHGKVPMIGPDGKPTLKESWDASRALDTHDFMLPTHENEQLAHEAFEREQMGRTLETWYRDTGRRGARWGHGGGEVVGTKSKYPGTSAAEHMPSNPWKSHIEKVFGKESRLAAYKKVADKVQEKIATAPTMHAALDAGFKIIKTGAAAKWPEPVVRALWDRAKALGVLDQRMREHALPPGTMSGQEHRAAGHRKLYHTGNHDYLRLSDYDPKHPLSVRNFLRDIATGPLREELKADNA